MRRNMIAILMGALLVFSSVAPTIYQAKTIKKERTSLLDVFRNILNKRSTYDPVSKIIDIIFKRDSYKNGKEKPNLPKTKLDNGADLPSWGIGYYWKYDMTFGFQYGSYVDMKDGHVKNMVAEVVDVKAGEYYIDLTSDGIEGRISINGLGSLNLNGEFSGEAVVDKWSLGMKKFEFRIKGEVGGMNLNVRFGMEMDRNVLNYLEFPLDVGKSWEVSCHAKYIFNAVVGPFVYSGSNEGDFTDSMVCTDFRNVNHFDSYLVSGELGNPSEIWYAPEIGFLSKVNEVLPNWGGLTAIFKLNILETNYIGRENNPPEKPLISGPTSGETGTRYRFTARSSDPDGDKIMYIFDWGDLETTETNFVESGEEVEVEHFWAFPGSYEITVKAIDSLGGESLWSDPIYIHLGGGGAREVRNVTVTIYKIEGIDDIEGNSWKLEPDWSYELYFFDGEKWLTRRYDCPSQCNTVTPNKEYEFQVTTATPKIKIKVWDRDEVIKLPVNNLVLDYHDLADVSGHMGGGKDNNIEDDRGAIYNGMYNLGKHGMIEEINEENDFVEKRDDYFITSGEFPPDGSTNSDENDAKVWFKIKDDYNPVLKIVKPPSGDYFYTNESIEFEAEIKGAIPPYSWRWDFDDGNISQERKPIHRYKQPGDYFVKVSVVDGTGYTIESKPIIIHVFSNTPPWTPNRPSGPSVVKIGKEYVYSTSTIDPDQVPWTQRIQYGWDWDGDLEVDEWTDFYRSGERCDVKHIWETIGTMRVSVKARDELGAESGWSPPLMVAVPYVKEDYLPTAVAEVNKMRITKEDASVTFISEKSHDNDDDGKEIEWIRWDFDGDGKWDTGTRLTDHWIRFKGNERITKDLSYLFDKDVEYATSLTSHGEENLKLRIYFARLEVMDDEGNKDNDFVQMTVVYSSYVNKWPTAVARVWPAQITKDHTILHFDSSKSRDNDQNGMEILKIRWDFDGDGKWDTGTRLTDHWIRFKGNENLSVDLYYLYNNVVTSSASGDKEGTRSRIYYAKLEVEDNEGSRDTDYVSITIHY